MATFNARGWRTDGVMQKHLRDAMGIVNRRHAIRWRYNESRDLLQQIELGFRVEDIAEWHERSLNGVGAHLRRLGAYPDDLPQPSAPSFVVSRASVNRCAFGHCFVVDPDNPRYHSRICPTCREEGNLQWTTTSLANSIRRT